MGDQTLFLTTILGAILMLFPSACHLYWGNLSMYTFSYIMATNSIPESVISAPWFMSTFDAMWMATLSLGGLVAKIVGRRTVLILCAFTFNISLCMCYFIINTSALVIMLFLGLVGGFSIGLLHGVILEITTEVSPKGRVGIVSVIVQNATNVGAAVINQFITLYINPNYLTSDWRVGPNVFFSQAVIIKRVPSFYVCLGLSSAVLQFSGICLLWKYCSKARNPSLVDIEMQMDIPQPQTTDETFKSVSAPKAKKKKRKENKTEKDPILHSDDSDEMKAPPTFSQRSLECLKYCLRQRQYYILLFLNIINGINFGIIPSYYKEIGRQGIKDEALLTSVGSISLITTIPISLLTGLIFDKFGAKLSLLNLYAVMAILVAFYCVTPYLGVSLYLVATILLMGLLNSMEFILTPSIVPALGGDHFSLKLGLVRSPSMLVMPCLNDVVSYVIRRYGYYLLFTCLSIAEVICTFLILLY